MSLFNKRLFTDFGEIDSCSANCTNCIRHDILNIHET